MRVFCAPACGWGRVLDCEEIKESCYEVDGEERYSLGETNPQ